MAVPVPVPAWPATVPTPEYQGPAVAVMASSEPAPAAPPSREPAPATTEYWDCPTAPLGQAWSASTTAAGWGSTVRFLPGPPPGKEWSVKALGADATRLAVRTACMASRIPQVGQE